MDRQPPERGEERPWISVLIPARNEAANIGDCLRSLLLQDDRMEIVVADDGSQDDTAAIVEQLARDAPRLQLLRVPPLPDGWTGKNHALQVAAPLAKGDWLLFTDADTRHTEGALRGVVEWAEKAGLDLVSCSPVQHTETWWEAAILPQVCHLLDRLYPFARVNDPGDSLAATHGAFLLVRRETYFRLGGHQAVRGEVLEDVALGKLAKQAGYRIWFGPGDGVVSMRMYRRLPDLWQGWTKNLFLLLGRDHSAVWRVAAELAARQWLPPLAGLGLLALGFPAAWGGVAALAYSAVEHLRYARSLRGPWRLQATLLMAPGAFLLFLLLLNSRRRYSRKLGVEWKGRRYPAEG